jgi:hypothetical protein
MCKQVCSLLHQRYKDFAPTLLTGLQKMFFPGKGDEIESDRSSRAMRKRSTLRLLMELYFCGVFEEGNLFVNIVKDLTNTDHLQDRETTQTNLSLLVSFARQGRGLLSLPLSGQDGQEEVFLHQHQRFNLLVTMFFIFLFPRTSTPCIFSEFQGASQLPEIASLTFPLTVGCLCVQLYKELSMTADQKKLLRKMFQSFLDAVVELLQSEHVVGLNFYFDVEPVLLGVAS